MSDSTSSEGSGEGYVGRHVRAREECRIVDSIIAKLVRMINSAPFCIFHNEPYKQKLSALIQQRGELLDVLLEEAQGEPLEIPVMSAGAEGAAVTMAEIDGAVGGALGGRHVVKVQTGQDSWASSYFSMHDLLFRK